MTDPHPVPPVVTGPASETITQAELAEAFEHEIDGCYVGGREFAVNVFAYVRERRAPDLITEWPPVAAALDRPTIDTEAPDAQSPQAGSPGPVAAATAWAGGKSAEAWNTAATAIPEEWVKAAENHYSMHGAGLLRNILAGVAPLIAAEAVSAEREQAGAGRVRVLRWRERAEAAEEKLADLRCLAEGCRELASNGRDLDANCTASSAYRAVAGDILAIIGRETKGGAPYDRDFDGPVL